MKIRVGLLAASALLLSATGAMAVSAGLNADANAAFLAANSHKPGVHLTRDGVQYKIIKTGFQQQPKDGDVVTVNFTLSLVNGEQIAATEEDYAPQIKLNGPILPAGAKEALKMMRVGDRWQIVVPPALGYGPAGALQGAVPPNQSLVYDIELLAVTTPPAEPKKDEDNELPPPPPAAAVH
jgi:FKBP-type peptidyl-prolyl cis-trans isomerase